VFSNQPDSRRVAEAVVAARPFSSWSDVDAIPGIGSARMKRLKDNFDLD
jgi:DNA uptake protein ComE-like DNA-binding protein